MPAATAAIELATARSASLWVWIPQLTAGASGSASSEPRTSPMIETSSLVIVPVAVEEMLGVVDGLATVVDDEPDRVGDHVEVLRGGRAKDFDDVEQPRLAEDRHDRGLGGHQLAQVGIVAGLVRAMPGRAERRELRALPAHLASRCEEVDVLRVRPRPAALDERHPELVEHPCHTQLVGERQRDVLALRPVAQCRVVEDDRGVAHAATPAPVASASSTAVVNPVVPTTTSPSVGSAGSARSPVRQPSASARATAVSIASAASGRPSDVRSSIAAERIVPIGFAMSRPAMSGAEPWIGS